MSERRDVVVIGTSAGGLGALKQLVAGLPADFPAAVLVVMHIGAQESVLPQLLSPHSALPIRHAVNQEPIESGTILVAPPDHHLLVEGRNVRLSHGPKENFARPAIDPLFRSAAFTCRSQTIGMVLTGHLDDGTIGLQAIKACGGIAIVQDPAEAEAPSMPRSAVEHVDVDFCLPLNRIPDVLVELVKTPVEPAKRRSVPRWIPEENRIVREDFDMEKLKKIAKPSMFTCTECHGALWEIEGVTPSHFRCHTGHAFTARALAAGQTQAVEESIWAAVRALHEKEAMLKRFARTAAENERVAAAQEHEAAAAQAAQQAEMLRKIISA